MIRLHHCPQTRSMRSLWLLHELGIEFAVKTYGFGPEIKAETYLDLNPTGRVPSLEIDGDVLFESGAIAEVLCERHPDAGFGRGAGDPERAAWLNWVHYAETVSQHVAALTQQHVMLFEDWMRSPTVMKLEAARLRKCYGAIDDALGGQAYLLPCGFSAADIGVGQAVYMGAHFAALDGFEHLQDWMARLQARPAFQASLPDDANRLYQQDFYPAWEQPK
ncbi:glutathione S-transferase family protein [Yoonia sp. 208BN28-4]|uniref:glutathione S-transferase family protein n=1 Tax=Yoonia sp. 208BN28-4 TaxID=3126505 RepID=UPI0030AF179F